MTIRGAPPAGRAGALMSPQPGNEIQVKQDVDAALRHPETVKLSRPPGLPEGAKPLQINRTRTSATEAYRVGDETYVHKTSQKLGPRDEPVGPAKSEWYQLGTTPPALKEALDAAKPKPPEDVRAELRKLKDSVNTGEYSKANAPKKEDVLQRVPLRGQRPHSFAAHVLKGTPTKVVIERLTTGGSAALPPGSEVYSKPIALPKGAAPSNFDWSELKGPPPSTFTPR